MTPQDWDRAVGEIGPRLYRYFRFKGFGEQASDLTQDTFVRVIQKLGAFDSSKGTLLSFSIGVGNFILLEHRKKQRPTSGEVPELSDDSAFEERIETLSDAEQLRRFVKKLPPILQDTLYFYYDEELTTREIGKILNLPEGTIKSHLFRAREMLREMMPEESRSH